MSVLSDKTLKKDFNLLFQDADEKNVSYCAYKFFPGKLFPPGKPSGAGAVIDWTTKNVRDWPTGTSHEVNPGELLVLRTRESVTIPADKCGLWYQTDSLSKGGLLLVNMSLVPPKYSGPLSCTFVNFGKYPVKITPSTPVSKMVLLSIDAAVDTKPPSPWDVRKYDEGLYDTAREAPTSFLQVADHTHKVEKMIEGAKSEFEVIKKTAHDSISAALREELTKEKANIMDEIGIKFWKTFPKTAGIIALLAVVHVTVNYFSEEYANTLAKKSADKLEEEVKGELAKIGGGPAFVYSGSAESKALLERIVNLEAKIDSLGKEKAKKKEGP